MHTSRLFFEFDFRYKKILNIHNIYHFSFLADLKNTPFSNGSWQNFSKYPFIRKIMITKSVFVS